MDLKQACKILEVSESCSLAEIKQAYRDMVQIWHPDRYSQNERLQRKAQEKMKELNAAYDCLSSHITSHKDTGFTDSESKYGSPAYRIIVCWSCGIKNRVRPSADYARAVCGKCGSNLYQGKQGKNFNDECGEEEVTLCGDGECIGKIDLTGRCTFCGKTYEEGIEAEKSKAEIRKKQQQVSKQRTRSKKKSIYISVIIGLVIMSIVILLNSRSSSDSKPGSSSYATKATPKLSDSIGQPSPNSGTANRLGVPIELEPVNPNRLRTGSVPYTGEIRLGHSEITVDNGTDTDAVVRVVRFGESNQQKVRNFYVRSHDQFIAKRIPPGEYVLRVAFGTDWNPETRRFNYRKSFTETQTFTVEESVSTELREDGEVLRTRSSKLSITLHKVPHGNFQNHPINEEEFWQ